VSRATRRLFFALWPHEAAQAALAEAARAIVQSSGGRAVPAHNFHLTLVFLGSVDESRFAQLAPIAASAAAAFAHGRQPVVVDLDRIEHWRRPEILCATPSAQRPGVAMLSDTLKRALMEQGFVPDAVPEFRAHVTLARRVSTPVCALPIAPQLWSFSEFVMVESQRQRQGSVYSALASFPLS
jgi:2'-5' RNA ligase